MTLSNTHIQSLWSTADTGGILENSGTFTYTGGGGGDPTWIGMAFLNHGTVGLSTGQLKITNRSTVTGNYSMKMDGGTLRLTNGMNLTVDQGYYQTGGLFTVADTSAAKLSGNAELDGGNVSVGTATDFGGLRVTGNLKFDGAELDVKIAGGQSNSEDQITSGGTVTLTQNSKLVATALGAVVAGKVWIVLGADTNNIVGNFGSFNLPNGVFDVTNNNVYDLKS
jgi:uncharacterized protein with beta-barrel porin domain